VNGKEEGQAASALLRFVPLESGWLHSGALGLVSPWPPGHDYIGALFGSKALFVDGAQKSPEFNGAEGDSSQALVRIFG
jgi:hypothetical protein